MLDGTDFTYLHMGMISNRDAALAYHALGLGVIPIQPDSKRFIAELCYPQCFERLPTTAEVESWWEQAPQARVGLALGINGLTVLDFEQASEYRRFHYLHARLIHRPFGPVPAGEPFDLALYRLINKVHQMPKARTPSGGLHLYFKQWDADSKYGYTDLAYLNQQTVVNLLDYQRYVVAPPSAGYAWKDVFHLDAIPLLTVEEFRTLRTLCSLLGDGSVDDGSPYDVNYAEWE